MTFPDSLWVGIPAPTSSGDAPGGLQLPRGLSVPSPTLAGQQPHPGVLFPAAP